MRGRPQKNEPAEHLPRLVIAEQKTVERTIRSVQTLATCFPQLAAVLVRLIVQEGRSFARQPRGRRLMRELSESEWVERGRILWQACGMDALLTEPVDRNPEVLISTWIRLLREELIRDSVEQTLSKLILRSQAEPDEHCA